MPVAISYPGVYIEEIPSGVRTIVGVATSITAFIGRALRGPVEDPITINSYGEYERIFGGLWLQSAMSFAVGLLIPPATSAAMLIGGYINYRIKKRRENDTGYDSSYQAFIDPAETKNSRILSGVIAGEAIVIVIWVLLTAILFFTL